jgi:hypothetical protein
MLSVGKEVILPHLCFKLEVVLSKNNKLQFSKDAFDLLKNKD